MSTITASSTAAYSTQQPTGTLVFVASDGTACVIYADGTNVNIAYASSPYTSWTSVVQMSGSLFMMQAGDFRAGTDNIDTIGGGAAAGKPTYKLLTKSGATWTVGSGTQINATPMGSSGVGNVAKWCGQDPQARYWAIVGGASPYTSSVAYTATAPLTPSSWVQNVATTQTGDQYQPAGDIVGNYLVKTYWNGTAIQYHRLDVSAATLGSWSTGATIANLGGSPNASSRMQWLTISSTKAMLVYSTSSGIYAQTYDSSTDTFSTATQLSTTGNDQHPCLATDGAGQAWAIWCAYQATNNYSLVSKKYDGTSWASSATTLVSSGTNITNPSAGYGASTIGVTYTVGTASPYTVAWTSFANVTTLSRSIGASVALLATRTRSIGASAALRATPSRSLASTAALLATRTRSIASTAALLATRTRSIASTAALLATRTRSLASTAALLATRSRSIGASAALRATPSRAITSSAAVRATPSRSIGASAALRATPSRSLATSAALLATRTRSLGVAGALLATRTRSLGVAGALLATRTRSLATSAAVRATPSRPAPALAALLATRTRSITSSAAVRATSSRASATSAAVRATSSRASSSQVALVATPTRVMGASVAVRRTAGRVLPATAALAMPAHRQIGAVGVVRATSVRVVGASVLLQVVGLVRRVPSVAPLSARGQRGVPGAAVVAEATMSVLVPTGVMAVEVPTGVMAVEVPTGVMAITIGE